MRRVANDKPSSVFGLRKDVLATAGAVVRCALAGALVLACSACVDPAKTVNATAVSLLAPTHGEPLSTSPVKAISREPTVLGRYEMGLCDLVATPSHVYWLEIRYRPPPAGMGPGGSVLRCAEAGGALVRVSRSELEKQTIASLDYRPFGLERQGDRLYWTGAPCDGVSRTNTDFDWLWTWKPGKGQIPETLGDRDRSYLGIAPVPGAVYVSDRFGRGGIFRFTEPSARAETIVPEGQSTWIVAADRASLFWTDRSWALWETDLSTRQSKKRLSLGAMPSDAYLFTGGLLIRTTESILVVSRETMTIERNIPIPSYGDRGAGALSRNRHYIWADGTDILSRLDVRTGVVQTVIAPGAKNACGVAVDEDALFWADRGEGQVFAWEVSAFDSPRAKPAKLGESGDAGAR